METFIGTQGDASFYGMIFGAIFLLFVALIVWLLPDRKSKPPVGVKVKRLHSEAKLPERASAGAGAFDIRCVIDSPPDWVISHTEVRQGVKLGKGDSFKLRTGLAFEIPEGYVMLVFSRSGHGFNYGVRLGNCVAVIDSDYRGELLISLRNDGDTNLAIEHGDRIAQAIIIPLPDVEYYFAFELSYTARGESGLGSTGDA